MPNLPRLRLGLFAFFLSRLLSFLVLLARFPGDLVECFLGRSLGFFCFAFLAFLLGGGFAGVVGGDGGDVRGVYVDEGGGGGVIVEDLRGRWGASVGWEGSVSGASPD